VAPPAAPPVRRVRPRTTAAALALCALLALAAWTAIGWKVLPRPYSSGARPPAACAATTAGPACGERVQSVP
jgi:hypothetical protein